MNERLGIVEERQAQRKKWGRFTDPPKLTPMVEQPVDDVDAFLTDVAELLSTRACRPREEPVAYEPSRAVTIQNVQRVFLAVLAESGYRIKGDAYTRHHLTNRERARVYSWPRQVCIALVRTICGSEQSYPVIGRAFGGKDHTTVMHAIDKAPVRCAEDPLFAAVHAKVLAIFEAKQ